MKYKEIVPYCINQNRTYKETASVFDVSYSQLMYKHLSISKAIYYK